MDFKIELVPLAVTDIDRAKAFYEKVRSMSVTARGTSSILKSMVISSSL